MKTLLKIYAASCVVVVAFFAVFALPWWEVLPFSGAVAAMLFGVTVLAIVAVYILRLRSTETFEFGHFLATRGGFWIITAACFGFLVFLAGLLIYVAPQSVEPAFERGAMPVAALLAVLFWLALVFMFAFLTFQMFASVSALLRIRRLKSSLASLAIAAVCLAMATVFFSLFVEMINDVFARIPVSTQWTFIWIFAGSLTAAGILYGCLGRTSEILDGEAETK